MNFDHPKSVRKKYDYRTSKIYPNEIGWKSDKTCRPISVRNFFRNLCFQGWLLNITLNFAYVLKNFSSILFGGMMAHLPDKNFARYILMLYILFCLVIRTAYQGVQFNLMFMVRVFKENFNRFYRFQLLLLSFVLFSKDIRPKDVQTIDEMLENNFTIYVDAKTKNWLNEMELSQKSSLKNKVWEGFQNFYFLFFSD